MKNNMKNSEKKTNAVSSMQNSQKKTSAKAENCGKPQDATDCR